MKRKLFLSLVAFLTTLTLVACASNSNQPPEAPDESGIVPVNWVQINPPPGVNGPCFAYFITKDEGMYRATGFSGVYCTP